MFPSRALAFALAPFFLVVTLIVSAFFIPVPVQAISFAAFDKMGSADQAEFVAVMVDVAEASLRKAGKADAAARLDQVFANTNPAVSSSEGVAQLEADIDKARSSRVPVQQAMLWTMEYFHIDVPVSVSNDIKAIPEGFRPVTYAEFHAKSPEEQRRIIKAYGLVGALDYFVRDIKERGYKNSYFNTLSEAKLDGEILDFIKTQFPATGPQPGFAGAIKAMEPEQPGGNPGGPMNGVALYVVRHSEGILAAREKAIDEQAVMIPDGRLVFPKKNGVWVTVDKRGNQTPLEDSLQPVAERLRRCMERRQIFAEEGLKACSEEVGVPPAIPAEFNNKAKYGIYLYSHLGHLSNAEATTVYAGMVNTLGKDIVESAAEKVRTAERTPTEDLVTHVKEPYKVRPDGSKVEDYDVPFPPGVIGVYKSQLVAMEVLATEDTDDHYLLYLLKARFQENRRFLPNDADKWTYAKNAYDGLTRAFGREQVQSAAHLIHPATKRLLTGPIMNQQALGATRNDPFEAFEDIPARKDPPGLVKSPSACKEKLVSPDSADLYAA